MPDPVRQFLPDRPKPKPWEQAILGMVKAGGETAKGISGMVSMAADAKIKEADDYDAGKSPQPEHYTPITERYKDEPWYKRIPKQVNDAMNMSANDPEVAAQVRHNSGAWASSSREIYKTIKQRADKEHTDAHSTMQKIEPQLGEVGKVTNFAANLVPGQRLLDITNGIGSAKSLSGGVVPALATIATRKLQKAGNLVRNAAQQAISNFVPDRPRPPQADATTPTAAQTPPDYFKPRKPAAIIGARN
jgi:hypothetical protein